MNRLPVSAFIIARNEGDRIGRTIAAVRDWVAEVIVIDSGSTDDTVAVAQSLGARVIHNPWPGYGPQKRFGEDQCRHDWLLNLDADEEVSPELAAEIRSLFTNGLPAAPGYAIRVVQVFPHQDRPMPGAPENLCLRLYDRRRGRFSDSLTHDSVILHGGEPVRLRMPIHHRSVRSVSDFIDKLNRYTDLQVAELSAKGRRFSRTRLVVEMPMSFVRFYFLRRYYTAGIYGFVLATILAFSRFARIAKLDEARRFPARRKE